MKNICLLLIFFALSLSACKTTKTSSTSSTTSRISIKKLNNIISKNAFDYKYFSTKARVNYDNKSFTANIKMKKDSIIWISLTGPFNIEGMRVLISDTRFQMIDRLNKTYYDMPLRFVENYIPIKAKLDLIQDLIVGNVLEKNIKKQKVETKENSFVVKGNIANLVSTYAIHQTGRPQNIDIQDKDTSISVNISFDRYEKVGKQNFAQKRKYLIEDKEKKYLLDLKFYKQQFSTVVFPFEIPKGYTRYK